MGWNYFYRTFGHLSVDTRKAYREIVLPQFIIDEDVDEDEGMAVPTDPISETILAHICLKLNIIDGGFWATCAFHVVLKRTMGDPGRFDNTFEMVNLFVDTAELGYEVSDVIFTAMHYVEQEACKIQKMYRDHLENRMKKRIFAHYVAPLQDTAYIISHFV